MSSVGADAAGRNAGLATCVGVVAGVLVHLGRKRAGCDGRHDDVVLDQPQRHAPRQVDQAGLAGGIGVGLPGIDRHAVDADAMLITLAALAAGRPGTSMRCRACVRKNGAFRFRSTTLSQPLSGKSVERRAPGGAGVVDQDVERGCSRSPARPPRGRCRPSWTHHAGSCGRGRSSTVQRRGVAGGGLAGADVDPWRPASGSPRRSCGRCRASRR
jgi:hypothetical protein